MLPSDIVTPRMPTIRALGNNHRRGRCVHGVDGGTGTKHDGDLHMTYTLCNIRLRGMGDDEDRNYVEDDEPRPITCKQCLQVLAQREHMSRILAERALAQRLDTTAAYLLVAHLDALDLDALCAPAPPQHRPALREAMLPYIDRIRRYGTGRRLDLE
jgi:hypothetical protein